MTPHELNLTVGMYTEKLKAKQEQNLSLAYMIENFHRTERLKPLNEILDELYKKEEKHMTDMEMLLNVHQLNAMFGGSVE